MLFASGKKYYTLHATNNYLNIKIDSKEREKDDSGDGNENELQHGEDEPG